MSTPRSGVSLLLALAVIAAAWRAAADPPATAPVTPAAPAGPSGAASGPSADDKELNAREAMALHDEAWALYADGRYRAAIDRLESALRIDPGGRELIYNLALLHEKLANPREAAGYYRRYLETETDPKVKARIQATLRRLEGAEREISSKLSPLAPSASLAAPSPPARPVRSWVVVTGSVAGAAFLVGSACGLAALAKNPGDNARTGNGVTSADLQADAHTAHSYAVIADLSFLVTAAAAGTALFLYMTTPRRAPPGPAVGARVASWPTTFAVSF
jgi:tetratricopeptide (TPR) repeat protein